MKRQSTPHSKTKTAPDLGAHWSPTRTRFAVWSPKADAAEVLLYGDDHRDAPGQVLPLTRHSGGFWRGTIADNLEGRYYTYRVRIDGDWREAVDPYARATGANGRRGQIVNLATTNPPGWSRDRRPPFRHPTDAIIYELHLRDATIHPASGVKRRGQYLGLAEPPVIAHLRELGVTHVHLLPLQDFESVDETRPGRQYNWGYDPQNYNVPEGSYASDPHDGRVRIREFKQLIMALHRAGIRVVMDVVYNHTFRARDSCFNKLAPGCYYRLNPDGSFANGSGCGNETASDHPMFRRFMIDSLCYWAREYHVDGFRFDLMGLHDLETMRRIRAALDRVDRSIILYGEGWTGGDSPLPAARRAQKTNVRKLDRIAAFSDTIRDALKGTVWDKNAKGFVSGADGLEEAIKAGVVASTRHPQVKYPPGDAWRGPWAEEPWRCITYDSCHDNYTLWDKLQLANPQANPSDLTRMNKLCAAIVLTAQGITLLHAGEEFARTKRGVENSYNQPDAINRLDWPRKRAFRDLFDYYRGLVALRRTYPELRLRSAAAIRRRLRFMQTKEKGVVAFRVGRLCVIFNGRPNPIRVPLPGRHWDILADEKGAGIKPRGQVTNDVAAVASFSALVLAHRAR